MKVILILSWLIVLSVPEVNLCAQQPRAISQPVTETFFGKQVTDPYRNLENLDDSNVMNWYKAQAAYTESQLKKMPMRDEMFKEILAEVDKYKYFIMAGPTMRLVRRGNTIFFVKAFSNEQFGKLYSRKGVNPDILLFDPNKNNKEPIPNVISGFSVNYDGSKIGVIVTKAGNEVGQLKIIDTKTKNVLDSTDRVWDPVDWINNETFTYGTFPTGDVHNSSFLLNTPAMKHVVGTKAAADLLLCSYEQNPGLVGDSAYWPQIYLPHKNSKFLVNQIQSAEQFNDAYLSHFDGTNFNDLKWYPFIKSKDQITSCMLQGDKAFGLSVRDNKKGRILLTSATHPDWEHAKIVAEGKKGSIGSLVPFTITKDFLYYVEVYGVEQKLYRVDLNDFSKIIEVKTPVTGTVVPINDSPIEPGLRVFITSWTQPPLIYEYDAKTNSFSKTVFRLAPEIKGNANIEVEETYYPSHDGVMVPVSIIKPKGLKKDGNNPVLIYGYGNYGMSMNPFFNSINSLYAKHGIIWVVAHVRGGGELGEEWRLGGYKSTKPNTWKDAIACAEFLIKEGYTQPSKLAIEGASAGGIFCGRAITERPDLFAVAIPQVGCLNTLRFEFTPNGPNHINEFGRVSNEDDFKNLYEMDSYVHVKNGVKYPATMITGGMNDPRVILWQPGKFAARLEEATSSGKPVLFRIDMEGGHGIGTTKDQVFKEQADILAFILWQTSGESNSHIKGF